MRKFVCFVVFDKISSSLFEIEIDLAKRGLGKVKVPSGIEPLSRGVWAVYSKRNRCHGEACSFYLLEYTFCNLTCI